LANSPLGVSSISSKLAAGLCGLAVFFILAAEAHAQAPEGLKIPGLNYRFDVRTAADNPDRLGLDFDVSYEARRATADPSGLHYGLKANVRGFQTFDRDVTDVDAMAAEVGLTGYHYGTSKNVRIPPEMVVRYLDLANKDVAQLSKEEIDELQTILPRLKNTTWYATFDLHYRYETNQTVTQDDHAFGAGIVAEVPVLANLLDVVPALTRSVTPDAVPRRAQPVRAFLGLDRVSGADDTDLGSISGKDGYWRTRLEAAWSTRIMQGFVLRTTFEGSLILGADDALKESGRDLTSFFQAWLLYPLSQKTNVLIKYVSGRLPPNYDEATVGKVGLSIALQ